METKDQILLEKFQKYSQEIEENFAQMLSLNPGLHLKFENQNQAFTDGQNITVDPSFMEIFTNENIRKEAINILNWPSDIIKTKEETIYVVEHAQLIHECLHQLYTEFPLPAYSDPLAYNSNRLKALATIANIIEDAYIEAVGATKYNNIKFFLQFFRTCISIVNNRNSLNQIPPSADKTKLLDEYINYFISYMLYPMDIISTPSPEIQEYIQKTKPLFMMATMTGEPKTRYTYVQKIFKIIEPIIPEDHEERVDQNQFNDKMPGSDTHNSNKTSHSPKDAQSQTPDSQLFPQPEEENAQNNSPKLKDPTEEYLGDDLFDNLPSESNNPPQSFKELMKQEMEKEEINGFMQSLKDIAQKQTQAKTEEKESEKTQCVRIGSNEFKEFTAHKNIIIEENHPKPDKSLRQEYNALYNEFKSNIDYYNGCFLQMLQTNRTVKENGYQYGLGISTKRLGDTKKRHWYRNVNEQDVPDLAVLILIDGSGSMSGEKRRNATKAALILHEVLEKQGINHSIVEHRAHGGKNTMESNILIDFNGKPDQKYNILKIHATNVNRDGLSLLWAERYISKQSNDNKLIIVISDGQPYHNEYSGKVAREDTHEIVKKIEKHNIGVIAIALEENESNVCYEDLKTIYPNLINCPEPKKLTRKLLEIIKKVI